MFIDGELIWAGCMSQGKYLVFSVFTSIGQRLFALVRLNMNLPQQWNRSVMAESQVKMPDYRRCNINVQLFLFNFFCSTFFVQLFLFNFFCSTFFVQLFLFNFFCSTFFVQLFLFNFFCSTFFVQLFLFNFFCSTFFVHLLINVHL